MTKKQLGDFKYLLIEFLRLILYSMRLLLKRFLKPSIVLLILSLSFLYTHIQTVNSFLWALDYHLIREYFSAMLSLPVAILIVGYVFMYKFKKGIEIFLRNSKINQFGTNGVVVSPKTEQNLSLQQKSPTSSSTTGNSNPTELTTSNKDGYSQKDVFFVLDQFLVFNSKSALWWFYNNKGSTLNQFLGEFTLTGNFDDVISQKNIIFQTLFTNKLLEIFDKGGYMVSNKGTNFLKYLGYGVDV